jgi:hypothetical protein
VLGEDPLRVMRFKGPPGRVFAAQFLWSRTSSRPQPLRWPTWFCRCATQRRRRDLHELRAASASHPRHPCPSGMETWEILREIAAEMSYRQMKYSTVDGDGQIMRVVDLS